jgi:hypothetical protein
VGVCEQALLLLHSLRYSSFGGQLTAACVQLIQVTMLTRGLKSHQHLALISAGRPIVILADMEKEEMEEELRNHNIDFLGSHVVCRSGPSLHMC